jgi:uncharacterized protein YbcV (DUF1398 family)
LNQILKRQTSRSHYGSKVPAVTITVFKYRNKIERKLNSDMYILNTWAETWLVKFNPQKTEFVIFSNNKNIDQVNFVFNGENIKQVEY